MLNISRPIILASQSPRRQQLLQALGLTFEVKSKNVEEHFPEEMPTNEIPTFLAKKKAVAFEEEIQEELVIAADTIVVHNGSVLNKPKDRAEAVEMLQRLSGSVHEVITGVCLYTKAQQTAFSDLTYVTFKTLTTEEIYYYIDTYAPFDKAGSYGAQEWMGMVGVERIEGSYFNVMGLPVHRLYEHLKAYSQ
ncbi:MAG: Maf family nucleotide pyrophosphatase [Thermonemataceae bacterium]